jgi:hypothetical protein
MTLLGTAIVEAVLSEYGRSEVLTRLSDPFWFQALGAVMGMDWHSSGITTSVMGALKRGLNPWASELGLYICGGRGKHSRLTPHEFRTIADKHGLQGDALVRYSRLTAKVDNTAIQDGFQLYLHAFAVTIDGEWAVIQQGMNATTRTARRYHWHSCTLRSFTEEPHVAVIGDSQGEMLNLVHRDAVGAQHSIVGLLREDPGQIAQAARHLVMPRRHHVESSDINVKRLGAVLAVAHDAEIHIFADALLLPGMGPRALQALALVVAEHLRPYLPALVSYSRFVELVSRALVPLCGYLHTRTGRCTGITFVDSTPLAVCHNRRISRHKVFAGYATRGKTSMGWFFGFKLHLMVNDEGELLAFRVTSGEVADKAPVRRMARGVWGQLCGDRGYISKALRAALWAQGLELITLIRRNMKLQLIRLWDRILLRKRSLIETINDQLKNISQIERKHLTLRTRIKRLTRKTICFSRSIQMHDIVIGLFVNRVVFQTWI